MNHNASIQSLSPITRRGILLLVAILTLTSVRVQAAQASRGIAGRSGLAFGVRSYRDDTGTRSCCAGSDRRVA